nr:hypothetical protein CFP56_01976 [Quercus suber]
MKIIKMAMHHLFFFFPGVLIWKTGFAIDSPPISSFTVLVIVRENFISITYKLLIIHAFRVLMTQVKRRLILKKPQIASPSLH